MNNVLFCDQVTPLSIENEYGGTPPEGITAIEPSHSQLGLLTDVIKDRISAGVVVLQLPEYDIKLPKPYITSVASLEELENEAFEFKVYPVPFDESLSLSFNADCFLPFEIQWFSSEGQLVDSKKGFSNYGVNTVDWKNIQIPPGTYLIVLHLGNKFTSKIIVK